MHPHQHRIDLCNRALEAIRPVIPSDLHAEVHDCINRHDEWGLGIETLIDGLSEAEIRITAEQFALIEGAMASMDLADSSRVGSLGEHHVADGKDRDDHGNGSGNENEREQPEVAGRVADAS